MENLSEFVGATSRHAEKGSIPAANTPPREGDAQKMLGPWPKEEVQRYCEEVRSWILVLGSKARAVRYAQRGFLGGQENN